MHGNHLLKSQLGFVVLTAVLATQAQAQLVTYQFTGTKESGTAGVGNTISGSITLDVGATPDYFYEGPGGQYAFWTDGDFSIDGETDGGVFAGNSFGYDEDMFTSLAVDDQPESSSPSNSIWIETYGFAYDGVFRQIYFQTYNYPGYGGDGIASVPNPWEPFTFDYQVIWIYEWDPATNQYESGWFGLDTFTSAPATIIIDGCDTGIQDFVYDGKLVSQHLADCAADAKNHGDYASSVARLTNELVEAGLLTGKEKGVIVSCAAKSSIGK